MKTQQQLLGALISALLVGWVGCTPEPSESADSASSQDRFNTIQVAPTEGSNAMDAGASESGDTEVSGSDLPADTTLHEDVEDLLERPHSPFDDVAESPHDTTGPSPEDVVTAPPEQADTLEAQAGDGDASEGEVLVPSPETLTLTRDSTQITLEQSQSQSLFGQSWQIRFFKNPTYSCGVSGTYTFLVIEPMNMPDSEAPLWVFLHGGGIGYFDASGGYQTMKTANAEPVNNSEESLNALLQNRVLSQVLVGNNQLKDTTLRRRLEGGYRVLVPALCDHDLYSGRGTPYPNNPAPGAEVNGLQATMAAVDHVVANHPTTHVFAHGQSAGSAGAWSLAYQYHLEGIALSGVVMDAYLVTERLEALFEALKGTPGFPFGASFELQGVIDKVGAFVDPEMPEFPEPERAIEDGFDAVPLLDLVGDEDSFCGGHTAPIDAAAAAGFENTCYWLHDGLALAIANQMESPHQVSVIEGAGHVVTSKNGGAAITVVETFIDDILASDPPPPFD